MGLQRNFETICSAFLLLRGKEERKPKITTRYLVG
jgi:hypothetical protein